MERNHTKLNSNFLYVKKGVLKTKPPSIIHISEGILSRARRFWEHSGMGETESSSETGRPAVSWSLKVE